MRSLTELSERLAPTLEDLAAKSQETAELSARLQQRQAARQGTARQATAHARQGSARRRGARRSR
jgi:hypothetical protein